MTRTKRSQLRRSRAKAASNGRSSKGASGSRHCGESGHVLISKAAVESPTVFVPVDELRPSPENDKVYRPIDPRDPDNVALADSIREHGVREPLTVTLDHYVLSGHRRLVAAKLAELRIVPCRIVRRRRSEMTEDEYVKLLVEHNCQRVKTNAEKLREEVIRTDPDIAYQALLEHRGERSKVKPKPLHIGKVRHRAEITDAKRPFLDACCQIIDELKNFWPLSDRQIHYKLLNDPPLIHASKPKSTYRNDQKSYKALTDLLTRARLAGDIDVSAIADETRPVVEWDVHRDVAHFMRRELDGLFWDYHRDLMQSQANHVEIVGEKMTLQGTIRPVAMQYGITYTLGRGFCSLPPRQALADRFAGSGKDRLVLLFLSDFDPEGEEIPRSFARSMRDDFSVTSIHPVKVALNPQHVQCYKLPPNTKAKTTSAHYEKFRRQHGEYAYELEALEPAELQTLLRDAIDSVIDAVAFNRELDAEREDAAFLEARRKVVLDTLGNGDGTA